MGALADLSAEIAGAVATGGTSTVLVDARKRFPASGIAIASDLILTAEHVVTRDTDIRVQSPEGQIFGATVAGRDPGSDLAVLRVGEKGLRPAVRSASAPEVGQIVLALGRPGPNGVQASWGIVTAIGGPARTGRGGLLDAYVETETTPYPGFSGGPLVNAQGAVLGMNTSGLSRGGSLTIPADVAWPIAEALAAHGSIRRGYLGVRTQAVDLPDGSSGVLVIWIEEGGPAAKAGLLLGDVIISIAGRPARTPDDIFAIMASATVVGTTVDAAILRGGKPQNLTVRVGERP